VEHKCLRRENSSSFPVSRLLEPPGGAEHGLFMDKLEGRIRNHDREIEKMCNHHFQGFVDSITELLKVRGEAQKLKQCNIAATIDKLSHCLPVLEMYSRLQEQMKARRYYPALRTLEQLEHTCLPRASHYRFCTIMAENILVLRTQIRDIAMSDLKDFLESIRKHSDKIGETAMKQVSLQGVEGTSCCSISHCVQSNWSKTDSLWISL
ncbi:hypothetical protein Z043_111943, partial [Scleropages formosus]